MINTNEKHKNEVKDFYDATSPFWRDLWGIHVHHGYWKTGKESKEIAQNQLTEELAERVGIKDGMRILDVGCGMGGSSIWLSKKYNAKTIGITLSPIQVDMATKTAIKEKVDSKFIVMDAENATFDYPFDIIWTIEAVSHFSNPENFFILASKVLKPGGKIALIDWFQSEDLNEKQEKEIIKPIKDAMLVPSMTSRENYIKFASKYGFKIIATEDISEKVSKSWDIGMGIIANPNLWKLALKKGKMFVDFLKAVDLMRKGFSSKTFRYGILIAEK